MTTKKVIKLINNERINRMITTAKGCALNTADTCKIYAYDMCPKDYSPCAGMAQDQCGNDYGYCVILSQDTCVKDYTP